MKNTDFKYMREAVEADLTELLARNFDMTITEALDTLYNSETYTRLCNPDTGLYFQSSQYVYSFLKKELQTTKMG